MFEELMISFAQVVEPRFAVCCTAETILRAFTIAGKQKFAFLTLGGQ